MTRLVSCNDCHQLMVPNKVDFPIICDEPMAASDQGYCRACFPKHKVFGWDFFVELDETMDWSALSLGEFA